MIIADLVGIRVFATGGIGGVHRDGERTLDVSADLMELGRSAVAVVASGVKSILDIGRTLEYLETQGVCVATLNGAGEQGLDFPAFYTRSSGHRVPYAFRDAVDVAAAIDVALKLRLQSGMVIGVPVPQEFAMEGERRETCLLFRLDLDNYLYTYFYRGTNQCWDRRGIESCPGRRHYWQGCDAIPFGRHYRHHRRSQPKHQYGISPILQYFRYF